jgi:hypothetical protein
MLLRLRTGKIGAAVLIFGIAGGTMLLATGTAVQFAAKGLPFVEPWLGFALCVSPFVLAGIVVAFCRSELWLLPEERALRLLTYRPWLRRPRIEQASLDEYAGVLADRASDRDGGGAMVALVLKSGERVDVRQFKDEASASAFARELAERAGLWLRGELVTEEAPPAAAPT